MGRSASRRYRRRPAGPRGETGGLAKLLQRSAQADILRNYSVPMSRDEQLSTGALFGLSLAALREGRGSETEWANVVSMTNTSLVLAEYGFGPEHEPALVSALDGLFRAKERAQRTGKWGLDGDAMRAVALAFDVHQAQVEVVGQGHYTAAMNVVKQRVERGDIYRQAS